MTRSRPNIPAFRRRRFLNVEPRRFMYWHWYRIYASAQRTGRDLRFLP